MCVDFGDIESCSVRSECSLWALMGNERGLQVMLCIISVSTKVTGILPAHNIIPSAMQNKNIWDVRANANAQRCL